MRRRTVAGGLALVVASAGSAGWVGARSIRSPEEVAAQQGPPPPSRITVPVVRRELASTLVVRGTVRFGEPKQVVLPTSAIKAGSSQVVTVAPAKATTLDEGGKSMEIGGRPVLALRGDTPMYRDLRPGDTGTDVRQLEAALARLGFDPGTVDGAYDAATARAVDRWYRSVGYDGFGPTDAQRAALDNARDAAAKAAEAVRQAQAALTSARKPPEADKVLQGQEQVAKARAKVARLTDDEARQTAAAAAAVDAKTVALRAAVTASAAARAAYDQALAAADDPAPVGDAAAGVRKAQSVLAQAQRGLRTAQQGVTDAEVAVDDARASLSDAQRSEADAADGVVRAQQALDRANATPASTVPAGNGTVLVDEEGRLARIASAEVGLKQAQAGVRAAQAATRQAQRAVDSRTRAVDDARNAVAVAMQGLADAEAALARAEREVPKADQTMAERRAAVPAAETRLAQAEQAERQARADLDLAVAGVPASARDLAETRRSAESELRIAEAAAQTATRASDVTAAEAQVRSARAAQQRADSSLAELEQRAGIVVPANEIVFFPSLPLRIDDTNLSRGDAVNGAVMTVATSRLAVDSSLDLADASLAHVGSTATIDATDFGVSLTGTITELDTTPGTHGVDATKVYMEITPDADAPLPTATDQPDPPDQPDQPGPPGSLRRASLGSLNGQSVRVTIPVKSTGGPVLAVPTPAVSAAADGTSRVEIEDSPDRPTRFVTVTVGLSAEGLVAVTPVDGRLVEGMQVVVGSNTAAEVAGVVEPNDEGTRRDPADETATTVAADAS